MLIGSGLMARSCSAPVFQRDDVLVYAAGVSNSSCTDAAEFARERARLGEALGAAAGADAFVYFGTCSVADPEARDTPYVRHKLEMEALVSGHARHVILRLPQVAGHTPNPHTLLNFLYARVARSEAFKVWSRARRNIIDVADAAAIAGAILEDPGSRNALFSIANDRSYAMAEIVAAMEAALGKPAVCETLDRGSGYPIDTSATLPYQRRAAVAFGPGYLKRVLAKYYGARDAAPA